MDWEEDFPEIKGDLRPALRTLDLFNPSLWMSPSTTPSTWSVPYIPSGIWLEIKELFGITGLRQTGLLVLVPEGTGGKFTGGALYLWWVCVSMHVLCMGEHVNVYILYVSHVCMCVVCSVCVYVCCIVYVVCALHVYVYILLHIYCVCRCVCAACVWVSVCVCQFSIFFFQIYIQEVKEKMCHNLWRIQPQIK